MSFLEKLGLGRKSHLSAPVIGEKKKDQEQSSAFRNNVYVRVLIILGFMVVLFLAVPKLSFKEKPSYAIGEPWKAKDLTAPFTFAIQKSDAELKNDKEAARESIAPIYYRNTNVDVAIDAKLDSLFQNIQPVLQAYNKWQSNPDKRPTSYTNDSLKFVRKKNASHVQLSDQAWNALLNNYKTTSVQNQAADTKTAPHRSFIGPDLHNNLQHIISDILAAGIINQPKEKLDHHKITLRNRKQSTEQTVTKASLRDVQEAHEYAHYRLTRLYHTGIAKAGTELFNQAIQPNLIYSQAQTQAQIDKAIGGISTTKGAIAKGQVIIRKGDIITPQKYRVLQSLNQARSQKASDLERWVHYGGDVLAIIAIVFIFFIYLYLYRRQIFGDNAMLLLVLLNMGLACVASSLLYQFSSISLYIVPIALVPIILTIIFDSRVGILATITLALLVALINGNNFEFATATIVGCSLGLFSVRDIKKRSQFFFITPGIVFISYTVVIVGFSMNSFQGWDLLLNHLLLVFINTIFLLFTYPLILLFERSFNITTDLTLIELSDTNLPLLKELMNKAPGTFHHSLQVANLAEAAAGAIRANGLLCRVAALYHDIGKMENPGYFTENQTAYNEHDKLKPRMSALVIKAHVSNGVKMAREHNLPEVIIKFIKAHHGTSVIRYFYEKAKEQTDEEKDEIMKEDYCYDGPIPSTKEEGIVMLADGVEAASRALKDPNYQKLESLIDKMIEIRVNEGQLNKTPLTFQDLSTIKKTFLNILVGIYHSRVEYPEDEETTSDKKEEKPAKKKTPSLQKPAETPVPAEGNWIEPPKRPADDYYNS